MIAGVDAEVDAEVVVAATRVTAKEDPGKVSWWAKDAERTLEEIQTGGASTE